jgi:cytochrome c553
MKRAAILALALARLCDGAVAQSVPDATAMHLRVLAASCAPCHGTNGRAIEGAALPGLAGRPAPELSRLMHEFKSGQRRSTLMQQVARGYSDAQIEQLAAYFATQK